MKSDTNKPDRQKAWETYSLSYDSILPKLPFYQEVVKRHVTAMTENGIYNVIDIGAGTGNVSLELLIKNRRVTAIDTSSAMLARLRGKVVPQYKGNINIIEQNAEDLSQFADNSFDGVTILLAMYDMAHPIAAFCEAIRILRPGGFLIVTEIKKCFRLQTLIDFVNEFLRRENLFLSLKHHWDRVITANTLLDPSNRDARLFSEDIIEKLRESGFFIQSMQDSHLGNCATILAKK